MNKMYTNPDDYKYRDCHVIFQVSSLVCVFDNWHCERGELKTVYNPEVEDQVLIIDMNTKMTTPGKPRHRVLGFDHPFLTLQCKL